LVQSGEIDAFKVGKQWRIVREDIIRYLKRQ